ncbi:MAG: hypothetical protein ACRDPE_23680 [Solirubrobacterales bacterium]
MAGAAVAIVLAVGGSSEPVEPAEANLAPCGAEGGVGASPADWRRATATAGPLAIVPGSLQTATRAGDGQFHARLRVFVGGHHFVVLSVPLDLRDRVFLYYGQVVDDRGRKPGSLFGAPGYAETEFQPCRHEPGTVWSGGIRVIGEGPVRLLVTVEGRPTSTPLVLGRPGST